MPVAEFTRDGIRTGRDAAQTDANQARHALDNIAWGREKSSATFGRVYVHENSAVPLQQVYVARETYSTHLIVNPMTWRTIKHDMVAQEAFADTYSQGANGMKFIPMDGAFAQAVRTEARMDGKPAQKDLITDIEQRADRLVRAASGLSCAVVSPGQASIWFQEYAELERLLASAKGRLDKARSLVDTARAVLDGGLE